jgi:phage terminase large subunit-like protein
MPDVVTFDRLAPEIAKARLSQETETEYRRLYLSQWPTQGASKWLDLALWDACTGEFTASKDAVLYVGVDLSQCDDLCSVVYTWHTPDQFGVQSHFWVPKAKATYYEQKHGIPYSKWAHQGAIRLLDQPTIDADAAREIAGHIINVHKTHKVKAVCYDRSRADAVLKNLEDAGILCTPVPQGWTLTMGCQELERRLKEGTKALIIAKNPVLRFNAENVEVKRDDHGNFWPTKPGSKGTYAGKPHAKIDGISALVTALTEARKQALVATKKTRGGVSFVNFDDL